MCKVITLLLNYRLLLRDTINDFNAQNFVRNSPYAYRPFLSPAQDSHESIFCHVTLPPGTPLGAPPQTPVIGSRYRARHSRLSPYSKFRSDHWRMQGGPGGAMPPLAAWASTQNALKLAIFRLKIEKKISGEEAMPPPQTHLVFLCINIITT